MAMDRLDKLIDKARQDKGILAVFLFGSLARSVDYKGSDIDICLVLEPDSYTSIELSQKKLEYLDSFDMDVQIFQQLPLYIRIRIVKEGKTLFCRDEHKLYQIAFRTIQEFADFEHIYRDYLKEVQSDR